MCWPGVGEGARRRERGGAVGLQECSGPRGEASA